MKIIDYKIIREIITSHGLNKVNIREKTGEGILLIKSLYITDNQWYEAKLFINNCQIFKTNHSDIRIHLDLLVDLNSEISMEFELGLVELEIYKIERYEKTIIFEKSKYNYQTQNYQIIYLSNYEPELNISISTFSLIKLYLKSNVNDTFVEISKYSNKIKLYKKDSFHEFSIKTDDNFKIKIAPESSSTCYIQGFAIIYSTVTEIKKLTQEERKLTIKSFYISPKHYNLMLNFIDANKTIESIPYVAELITPLINWACFIDKIYSFGTNSQPIFLYKNKQFIGLFVARTEIMQVDLSMFIKESDQIEMWTIRNDDFRFNSFLNVYFTISNN